MRKQTLSLIILFFLNLTLGSGLYAQKLRKSSDTTIKKTTRTSPDEGQEIQRFSSFTFKTESTEGRKEIISSVIEECLYSLKMCQDKLYLGDIIDFNKMYLAYKEPETPESGIFSLFTLAPRKSMFYDIHGSKSAFLWTTRHHWGETLSRRGFTTYNDSNNNIRYFRYFWGESGEISRHYSVLSFEFTYDHIQREPNTFAKVVMNKTNTECTKTGCYDDYDDEYLGIERCEEFYGFGFDSYKYDGDYSERFECQIIIYPLIFETDYCYMETEMGDPWADNVYEALFYILLHEFGHIEHYWAGNTLSYNYTLDLNNSEEAADSFASSVWRECK